MSRNAEFYEDPSLSKQLDARERMQAMLNKLQTLKSKISELRAQCEELQKTNEHHGGAVLCDSCGLAIDSEQGIEARNFGEEARHYHKECFRKLWL